MEIKFISYDGEFPCLCYGTLVLEIDGVVYTFGYLGSNNIPNSYERFWTSGGSVWFDGDWEDHVEQGEWKLVAENLPDFLKPYGKKLIKLFNERVPYGCCGGCV